MTWKPTSAARPPLSTSSRPDLLAKEELLTLDGQIDEILPDGRFGVVLENGHRIIAYTAHAVPEAFEEFRSAGFDDVLIKPVTRDALLGALGGLEPGG